MAEVLTYSLLRTRFIWLFSKLELNFDLVLGCPSRNRPEIITPPLILVEPVLVERCFHFQASI